MQKSYIWRALAILTAVVVAVLILSNSKHSVPVVATTVAPGEAATIAQPATAGDTKPPSPNLAFAGDTKSPSPNLAFAGSDTKPKAPELAFADTRHAR